MYEELFKDVNKGVYFKLKIKGNSLTSLIFLFGLNKYLIGGN